MSAEETVELTYRHNRFLATVGLLLAPLIIVLVIAAAIWGIANGDGFLRKAEGTVVLLVGIYLCYVLREFIRGRYAFSTTYVVGDAGVRVVAPGKEPLHISWSEFSRGIDKRVLPAVLLFSSHSQDPVVFFKNGLRPDSPQYVQVRDLAARKLGKRMNSKWF